jgi:hypothetical protein
VGSCPPAHLACRPSLEGALSSAFRVLLSFERPAGESPRLRPRRTLKTAQLAKQTGSRQGPVLARSPAPARGSIHRQDSKGTWWMPWHQESMKGVDGCDKPR